jgi:hypothetical protein
MHVVVKEEVKFSMVYFCRGEENVYSSTLVMSLVRLYHILCSKTGHILFFCNAYEVTDYMLDYLCVCMMSLMLTSRVL